MFRAVQRRVRAAIRQEPYLGFNALGDVYLAGLWFPNSVQPGGGSRSAGADRACQTERRGRGLGATKDTSSIAVLEAFITRYRETFYAELARARIEDLKKQQVAIAAPPPAPPPVQQKPAQPAVAVAPTPAQAQYSDGIIKLGVMNDQSGTYSDLSGQGSVWAAKKAIEDFCKTTKCHDKIEVVFADHQNKPDVGSNIVRQWFDVDKVDAVVDVPTSSVALAVNTITQEKNKVFLVSGAAPSDLTGKDCTPNTIHWTYDTWALANGTGQPSSRRAATPGSS